MFNQFLDLFVTSPPQKQSVYIMQLFWETILIISLHINQTGSIISQHQDFNYARFIKIIEIFRNYHYGSAKQIAIILQYQKIIIVF